MDARQARIIYLKRLTELRNAFFQFTYAWDDLSSEDIELVNGIDWNGFNLCFEEVPHELTDALEQVTKLFQKGELK
jgi:hypothetical protein